MWLNYIFEATLLMFVLWTFSTLHHLHWVRRLPSFDDLAANFPAQQSDGKDRRCSIIIAARDEEARIEQTIRRLLAQKGVELEIIVVDDRSSDRTPEILRRLAAEDSRVRAHRVDHLPEGWLGKCHACHVGANAARGDWLLFTDADCWLKPDVIARALAAATREDADHVTIVSGLAEGTIGLKASHLMFLISLANWFSGVNRDRPKSFIGIGAFNLVRTSAYKACGGYEALRLTVLDDVKLGLLLRRAGKRTRAFLGGDDVECHWGKKAWDMVKIMEKNYFAAVDYKLGLVVAGTVFVLIVFGVLIAGLLSASLPGLLAAASPLLIAAPGLLLARRLGWRGRDLYAAFIIPMMFPLFLYTLLNSTFITLRQGGVRWRETLYPLETLRAGDVR